MRGTRQVVKGKEEMGDGQPYTKTKEKGEENRNIRESKHQEKRREEKGERKRYLKGKKWEKGEGVK